MRRQCYILSLMIFLLLGLFSSWAAEWEATITATNIDDPGVSPRLLTFGEDPGALDDYDPQDIPFPPPGQPPIALDAAFIIGGPFTRLVTDIKQKAAVNQWQLDVRSDTGSIGLTWDISGVPLDKCVLLRDGEIVDMRAQDSLELVQGQYSLTLEVLDDPDLAVSKTVDNSTPSEGDSIIYTVTLTNNGPNPATGIEITDLLPSGVTYISDTPGQGSYNSSTGLWSVGDMANGASITLTVTATVDPGTGGNTITNTVSVTSVDQVDPDVSNNSDSADITVQGADTIPPAAVTLATGDIATDSVVLTWIAPGDDNMEGTAFEYDIRYSGSAIKNERKWTIATQCANEPSLLLAGSSQSFAVTGLSPNTKYYFALKTADEALNWSEISNVVSATTNGGPDPTTQKMHVSSVVMSLRKAGPNINAVATVTVVDEADIEVEGALVLGHWTGLTGDIDEGVTDASGEVSLNSDKLRKPPAGQFTFTVNTVTREGRIYDETANFMNPPCGSISYPQASPAYAGAYRTDLKYAYPSPGNPEVWIPFTLSDVEHVVIRIYSATGGLVRTLDLGQKAPGIYVSKGKAAYWDGRSETGEEITSGLYFYLMEAGSFRAVKKTVILK